MIKIEGCQILRIDNIPGWQCVKMFNSSVIRMVTNSQWHSRRTKSRGKRAPKIMLESNVMIK